MNNFVTEKIEVEIDNVHPNPFNPNVMDKETFKKEIKSIQELGMIGAIIVRDHIIPGHYEILDGEHRWKALKELGYSKVRVETMGKIPDQQMKFLTIHLNNLRGKDDVFKRAEILKVLDEGQTQLLPWTEEEIENEKKLVEFDFSKYENIETIPERKFAQVIVLPMDTEEARVWNTAKAKMVEKKLITTDNTKKKQDIQMIMWLLRNVLPLLVKTENLDNGVIAFEE